MNGEPFSRYTLRALYPWAHQIIVVEGACQAARAYATSDGHSTDNTLEVLRRFKAEEDRDGKLEIVMAEDEGHPDGFWPREKDEMSAAYARRATGDYLWQVDMDEFYLPQDFPKIFDALSREPGVSRVDFLTQTFSGSPRIRVAGYFVSAYRFRRLFAWKTGYSYSTHRPPTVLDVDGQDTSCTGVLSAEMMARAGVFLYHYEQLFPKQVLEKCSYYAHRGIREVEESENWARDCYERISRPYRVHMMYAYPSWLERYAGSVPPEVDRMVEAVEVGLHPGISLRRNADIESLLASPRYRLGRAVLRSLQPAWTAYKSGRAVIGAARRRLRQTAA